MEKNLNELLLTTKNCLESHKNPEYNKLPYEFMTNKEFILKVLEIESVYTMAYSSIYTELKHRYNMSWGYNTELYNLVTDKEIISKAMETPFNVEDVPENFITLDIAKKIADSPCFHLLPEKWQFDDNVFGIFVNYLNKTNFFPIEHCDKEIISKALISLVKLNFDFTRDQNTTEALRRIVPQLNKEAMRYLVKVKPYYIEESIFKDDEEIVLEAIKVCGISFEVASQRLRSDITFIKKALKINVDSWFGIYYELTEDPALIKLRDEMLLKQNKTVSPWGWC